MCFGFCFSLFDFSSSAITFYHSYNVFWRRPVDERKAINLVIIEVKKVTDTEEYQNLIAHENDAQI